MRRSPVPLPAVLPAILVAFLAGACSDEPGPVGPEFAALVGTASAITCGDVVDGGIVGDVEVEPGGACALNGVTVRGNVKILEGGSLTISGGAVRGNVQGDKAWAVEVRNAWIGGDVQMQETAVNIIVDVTVRGNIQIEKAGAGDEGIVLVNGNDVLTGNIQVVENRVLTLEISGNDVRTGNLQVFKNGGDGAKGVTANVVAQNLQCKENASPFTAGGNTAGDREGQCGTRP